MNSEASTTPRERRVAARYVWEISVGIAAFLGLFLLLPNWWKTEPGTWPHLALTLLPILPLIWVVLALWRHLRNIDEMQREVLIRSLAFGFAITMITTLVIALLRGAGVALQGGEWIIFIAGMTSWGIAIPISTMNSDR